MKLDLGYEPGPPPEVLEAKRLRRRLVETWGMEGTSGDRVLVDAHLPTGVPARVVVMAHGADNSRAARYIEVSGKSFTRRGTAVVAMDAPRHGDRPGAAPLDRLPGLDATLLETWVKDHRRLLDAVGRRWPGTPIGLAGFSMGGLFGVPLMAVDDRVQAAAIVIAGSTRVSYPPRLELDERERAVLEETDPAVHASGVGSRPVLVLAARDDEIVPLESVHALHEAFAGDARLVVLPGTHTEWGRAAEWFRTLDRFFRDALG